MASEFSTPKAVRIVLPYSEKRLTNTGTFTVVCDSDDSRDKFQKKVVAKLNSIRPPEAGRVSPEDYYLTHMETGKPLPQTPFWTQLQKLADSESRVTLYLKTTAQDILQAQVVRVKAPQLDTTFSLRCEETVTIGELKAMLRKKLVQKGLLDNRVSTSEQPSVPEFGIGRLQSESLPDTARPLQLLAERGIRNKRILFLSLEKSSEVWSSLKTPSSLSSTLKRASKTNLGQEESAKEKEKSEDKDGIEIGADEQVFWRAITFNTKLNPDSFTPSPGSSPFLTPDGSPSTLMVQPPFPSSSSSSSSSSTASGLSQRWVTWSPSETNPTKSYRESVPYRSPTYKTQSLNLPSSGARGGGRGGKNGDESSPRGLSLPSTSRPQLPKHSPPSKPSPKKNGTNNTQETLKDISLEYDSKFRPNKKSPHHRSTLSDTSHSSLSQLSNSFTPELVPISKLSPYHGTGHDRNEKKISQNGTSDHHHREEDLKIILPKHSNLTTTPESPPPPPPPSSPPSEISQTSESFVPPPPSPLPSNTPTSFPTSESILPPPPPSPLPSNNPTSAIFLPTSESIVPPPPSPLPIHHHQQPPNSSSSSQVPKHSAAHAFLFSSDPSFMGTSESTYNFQVSPSMFPTADSFFNPPPLADYGKPK